MRLPPGNPMRSVLLLVLCFEAVCFGLAVPVMVLVSDRPPVVAAVAGGAAALLAVAAAALLRRPAGWPLGWLTQPVGIALGLLTPGMYVVGAVFAGLWVLAYGLGRKLDARNGQGGTEPHGPVVPGR